MKPLILLMLFLLAGCASMAQTVAEWHGVQGNTLPASCVTLTDGSVTCRQPVRH